MKLLRCLVLWSRSQLSCSLNQQTSNHMPRLDCPSMSAALNPGSDRVRVRPTHAASLGGQPGWGRVLLESSH